MAEAAKARMFVWEGKTRAGEVKKGEMEAADGAAVEARLRSMNIVPNRVRKKPLAIKLSLGGKSVSKRDLLIFTRQFATMIDAGLPLVQCLDILTNQMDNPAFRKVLASVKGRVEAGATFADALGDHPKVFGDLYVQLVSAGEIGGILDTILNRLAAYIEKAEKLKKKVKGAMVYPVIVLVIALGVTIVLLLFVTPTFEKMFKDFGGAMPAPTQFVIDLSTFLQHYIIHCIVAVGAFVFAFSAFIKNPSGRKIFDRAILQAPIIGPVIRKVAVARFTRTLGTMISSGVPILDGLNIVARSAGNKTVEAAILMTRQKISEGRTMAGPLLETKVFPPMVVQMIGVGEATGALDTMLNKIADFYDDEVDAAVGALTSMIEPFMMVFLGIVVGGFLIAMYMPIFQIAGSVN